jgi:hypothetical protein
VDNSNPAAPTYAIGAMPGPRRGDDPANPGRDIGLAAFILTWVAPLVGLIVAVIAKKRSEGAGFAQTDLARWAFVWSIVSLSVTGLLLVGYGALIVVAISSGLADAQPTY